jgi:hypothetical protein
MGRKVVNSAEESQRLMIVKRAERLVSKKKRRHDHVRPSLPSFLFNRPEPLCDTSRQEGQTLNKIRARRSYDSFSQSIPPSLCICPL